MMKTVRIADLKARLSEYLRGVRAGQSLTVMDRDTPIAQIVPIDSSKPRLVSRKPDPKATPLGRIPLPPRLPIKGDIVTLLLEERQGHR
jgi:prevent-host-death family protein